MTSFCFPARVLDLNNDVDKMELLRFKPEVSSLERSADLFAGSDACGLDVDEVSGVFDVLFW